MLSLTIAGNEKTPILVTSRFSSAVKRDQQPIMKPNSAVAGVQTPYRFRQDQRTKHVFLFVLVLLCCSFTTLCNAESDDDVVAMELPYGLERFPESVIRNYRERSKVRYNLILGSLKKVDGNWQSDTMRRLYGSLQRFTFQIPSSSNVDWVDNFYREQLLEKSGFREIYHCSSRACGSSNQWANGVFGVKELYGPDRNQLYRVYQSASTSDWDEYVVFYIIQRGNERIYAHFDFIRAQKDQTVPGAGQVTDKPTPRSSFIWHADEEKQDLQAWLEGVKPILQRDSARYLYVVGHTSLMLQPREAEALSLRDAEALAKELENMGIRRSQMWIVGLGRAANRHPAGSGESWIELFLD